MKTKTAPFINERVVRHLARNHYDLSFCDEQAMHDRNKGKITGTPFAISVLLPAALAYLVKYTTGDAQVVSTVFAAIFGPVSIYCIFVHWKQYRRLNRTWHYMVGDICLFNALIKSTGHENIGWNDLVSRGKDALIQLGEEFLIHELEATQSIQKARGLSNEAAIDIQKLNEQSTVLLALKLKSVCRQIEEKADRLARLKKGFEDLFDGAKRVLGSELDNGRGFGSFLRTEVLK